MALRYIINIGAAVLAVASSASAADGDAPKLTGFGFGAAITHAFDDEVVDAFVDTNGIIQTNERSRTDAGFILEGHFLAQKNDAFPLPSALDFLSPDCAPLSSDGTKPTHGLTCGRGFFLALETGGSHELLESIGFGYMWGFAHNGDTPPLGGLKQWNFGLGISVDPEAHRLADGFIEGQRLPAGQTEIRYQDDAEFGLMMIFTVGN